MPDLPSRAQREKELAAALLLILQDARTSLAVSAERVAAAAGDSLAKTYTDAVRNLAKVASVDGMPALSDQDLDAEASRWARGYAATLGREIADSTRDMIVIQADDGQDGNIDAIFGRKRAEMVAATEVTRAISVAEAWLLLFWSDAGFETGERIWHTEEDGKVCPVCRPLNRTPEAIWVGTAPAGPPAHPNCRCWLDYQVS